MSEKKTSSAPLKPGDVVHLRSGGPSMTVREVGESGNAVVCVWMADAKNMNLLTLYQTRIQRLIDKNIAHLRELQQERREALQKLVEEAATLPETEELPTEAA